MMKQVLNITFLLFFFVSCEMKQNTQENIEVETSRTPIDDKKKIFTLIDSAINFGNNKAYNKVASYYLLDDPEGFFYYALTMANKHNNPEACFHVYYTIAYSTPKQPKEALILMDEKSRNLALYYLLKSHEMGFKSAKYQINNIFGEGNPIPESKYYLQEFSKE